MRLPSLLAIACGLFATSLLFTSAQGVTLEDLRSNPKLTPETFAASFKEFEFKFRNEVQAPEVFLSSRSGDCDDYATLAASVLKEKGYTPRLMAVRMPGVVHVVCYVQETHSYLDYNLRKYPSRTVASGSSISEIADQVAASYGLKWTSASEFTYSDRTKRLVATVVTPAKDPAASKRQLAGLFGFRK
jgi:hypothetical protein